MSEVIKEPPLQRQVLDEQTRYATIEWAGFFSSLYRSAVNTKGFREAGGTTANRPDVGLWIGRQYFDTTLGYPVWVKSIGPDVWINGAGTTV